MLFRQMGVDERDETWETEDTDCEYGELTEAANEHKMDLDKKYLTDLKRRCVESGDYELLECLNRLDDI